MPHTSPSAPLARLHLAHVSLRIAPVRADDEHALPAAERALVAGSPPARRAQFATGRRLARAALGAEGVVVPALGADRHGAPAWPPGFVGSISHVDDLVVAATSTRWSGLGVDVAHRAALPAAQAAVLLDDDELDRAARVAHGLGATVHFAVKEACYKAVHPRLGHPIGYRDVLVVLDAPEPDGLAGAFTAGVRTPARAAVAVSGRWQVAERHVGALAVTGRQIAERGITG